MSKSTERCLCCGRALHPDRMTWLCMDGTAHTYHKDEAEIPTSHINQGGFPFGQACARAVLKRGGRLEVKA